MLTARHTRRRARDHRRQERAQDREARRAEMMKVRAWMDRLYGYMPASWCVHTVGITQASITNAIARGQVRQERLQLPGGHAVQLVSVQDVAKIRPRGGKQLRPVVIPAAAHPQAAGQVWTAGGMIDQGAADAEDRTAPLRVFPSPNSPTIPFPATAAPPPPKKRPRRATRKRPKGRGVARSTPAKRGPQRGSKRKTAPLGRKRAPNGGARRPASTGAPKRRARA